MAAIIREHYSETSDPNFFSPRHPSARRVLRWKGTLNYWNAEPGIKKSPRAPLTSPRSSPSCAAWRGRQFARRYRVTVFVAWIKNEDGTRGQVVARAWLSTREKRGHQSGHHLNVAKSEWFKTPPSVEGEPAERPIEFSTSTDESYFGEAKYTKIPR